MYGKNQTPRKQYIKLRNMHMVGNAQGEMRR